MKASACAWIAATTCLIATSSAWAELLVHEGFDYGTATSLQGMNGGVGFSTAWSVSSGTVELTGDGVSLESDAFTFAPVGSRVSAAGASVAIRSFASGVKMDLGAEGKVYYYSVMMRKSQTNAVNEYVQIRFVDDSVNERATVGFSSDDKFLIGTKLDGTVAPNTTYFLVCKIVTHPGTTLDEYSLKVYGPDDTVDSHEPSEWTVTMEEGSNVVLTRIRIYTGVNGTMDVDEFRLGTRWNDVAVYTPLGSVLSVR